MLDSADQLEKRAREAILDLRKSKLARGLPFMINSPELPEGQCWLEYPDGHIHLVKLSKSRTDFDNINIFSLDESNRFRKELGII